MFALRVSLHSGAVNQTWAEWALEGVTNSADVLMKALESIPFLGDLLMTSHYRVLITAVLVLGWTGRVTEFRG